MAQPHLTLFFAPGSSSMAPHIALHELGVAFEPRQVSFASRETRAPHVLAVNPEGKVPILLVDGRPLTEVAGILFYLAKQFPEAGLLPEAPDTAGRIELEAHVVSWMSFLAATVHPARRLGVEHVLPVFDRAEERLGARLSDRAAPRALGERAERGPSPEPWIFGRYSIVDIFLFRLFWRMAGSLHPPRERYPRLYAHYERAMERPAVERTIAIESAIGYELPA